MYFSKYPTSLYLGYNHPPYTPPVPQERIQEDLTYLTQLYPDHAKAYLPIIKSLIRKWDYETSFIYDQYPDRVTLARLVSTAMQNIGDTDDDIWLKELITVLIYNEILSLRQKKNQYIYI